jgi:hypothetical protein
MGVSLFYRGEEVQCPTFCITHSKGGRRASSRLTTKEGWQSTRNFAARLTTSLRWFLADYFFTFIKKGDPHGTYLHQSDLIMPILLNVTK